MYKLLGLDKAGRKMLNRAITACVAANMALFLSFAVILNILFILVKPLSGGGFSSLDARNLWVFSFCALGAAAVYFFAYRNEYRKTYEAAYNESEKIRLDVCERIRRLPLSFFNKKDLSELTTNIMADCATIEHTLSHVVPGLAANIITAALTCLLLALYDWRLSCALFAGLPVSIALVLLSRKIQTLRGERVVKVKLEAANRMQEYFEGIKVVKAFGLAGEKFESLKKTLQKMTREAIGFEFISGVFVVSAQMILQLGVGVVAVTGVILISGGVLNPVKLIFFALVSAKIYGPFLVLLTLLPELFFMLVSASRMQALRKEPVMDGEENPVFPNYNIELKNVTFAYQKDAVVKNLSLSIPQNSVTALVGPSGSGKTTVSRLIARFYDAQSGEITVGGKNIRDIEPQALMKSMSFVFQDVVLFNDTVMNNIRIGKQGATDEDVYRAAKNARCDEFIRAMPEGYKTVIGENGSTLSGGERQRVSIARALLKDAPIVLLDEATASLDPENETGIQAAISELVKGRTVIVIAHRLRTVLNADKIAVLENGRLVEEGGGKELIAQNGLFARLYAIQQENLGWSVGVPE
ncbi:MAG: ABC transporter ATP-binding protein/permease [Spirochaetaceae bacterium]|nr:ABC transporter ATP-binding protein/permease [Spirochaetaceae bacterium]